MKTDSLHQLAQATFAIVVEAAQIARDFFDRSTNSTLDYQTKQDNTLVSEADIALSAFIVTRLGELTPAIPVISEESQQIDYQYRCKWQKLWLVDPLDGTRHFVAGNPDYSINIALIEQAKPVVGVVYAPSHQRGYMASIGSGAWRVDVKGAKRQIYTNKTKSNWMEIMVSHGIPGWRLRRFVAQHQQFMFQRMGSALKTCWIAEGKADIYPRFGVTYEWDTAAAQVVLEEAGGWICDSEGKPLTYNKPQLQNPEFIAGSSWYQPPRVWY